MHLHIDIDSINELATIIALIRHEPLDPSILTHLTEMLKAPTDALAAAVAATPTP